LNYSYIEKLKDSEYCSQNFASGKYPVLCFLDFPSDKKEDPEQTLNECIAILKRLNNEKLKTILESF